MFTVRRKAYLARDDGRREAVVGHGKGIGVARKDLKGRGNERSSETRVNVIHEFFAFAVLNRKGRRGKLNSSSHVFEEWTTAPSQRVIFAGPLTDMGPRLNKGFGNRYSGKAHCHCNTEPCSHKTGSRETFACTHRAAGILSGQVHFRSLTHFSPHAVSVPLEVRHARAPVLKGEGLGVFLAETLGVPTLRQDLPDHRQSAEVDLEVLGGAGGAGGRRSGASDRPRRTPSPASRGIQMEPEMRQLWQKTALRLGLRLRGELFPSRLRIKFPPPSLALSLLLAPIRTFFG